MLKETVIAISQALQDTFGDGYPVYVEDVEQDLDNHCFMIKMLNPSQSLIAGIRYESRQPFDIHYFTSDAGELPSVIEKLYDCLEYIIVEGDMVRGTDMKTETVDGVLHFFVDYNVFVLKKNTDDVKMDDLETEVMERVGHGDKKSRSSENSTKTDFVH